jgi:signal transduction histidine kinase
MSNPLQLLFLEDDLEDAEIIQDFLKKEGMSFRATITATKEEYVDALNRQEFDVILSDHSLVSFNSLEALIIRNKKNILTPFLVLSGTIQEEFAVSLIRDGASDYILKDRLQRLPTAILQAIAKRRLSEEKLAAEKELIKSNERFYLAAKATTDAIWDWNVETNEMFLGEGFQTLFGYTVNQPGTSLGFWLENIYPEDKERVTKSLHTVLYNSLKVSWSEEYRYITSEGAIATVINKGIVLRDINTNPYRMVGAIQDITELTKRNDELKEFSFIISHNLNSPLSNLLALPKLMDYNNLSDYNRELLQMMGESTWNIKQVVDHLSHTLILKNSPIELEEIEIDKFFAKTHQKFRAEIKELDFNIKTEFKLAVLKTKPAYLESIFINLLSNSLKFRSPKRQLSLKITAEPFINGSTKIVFSDNGLGINMARNKRKLFRLHQRLHDVGDGLGFGLYLIKTQIKALGGSISVDSQVDKGTTFTIIL